MKIAIIGVGLYPFGRHEGVSAFDMGASAIRRALSDAGLRWIDMQFAFGGSVGGVLNGEQSTAPDSLVSELGLTGLPFANVSNGCSTAGTAVSMAATSIASGHYDIGIAVGFDKHPRGHFSLPAEYFGLPDWYSQEGLMLSTQYFALKATRYMHEHGISRSSLAKVAARAYGNAQRKGDAWRREGWTETDVANSPMLSYPLTKYMFCGPNEGAGAIVLCRADQAARYSSRPVFLRGIASRTRQLGTFEVFSPWLTPERALSPVEDASAACFGQAGIGPEEVDIAQLQDTDAASEIAFMAETGLVGHGEQEQLVQSGQTHIGGRLPINTDGGLIGNGEPIGASGMRQIHEIVLQLRGDAGVRQVPHTPRVGFTQVHGAPGVSACSILST